MAIGIFQNFFGNNLTSPFSKKLPLLLFGQLFHASKKPLIGNNLGSIDLLSSSEVPILLRVAFRFHQKSPFPQFLEMAFLDHKRILDLHKLEPKSYLKLAFLI